MFHKKVTSCFEKKKTGASKCCFMRKSSTNVAGGFQVKWTKIQTQTHRDRNNLIKFGSLWV